MGMKSSGRVVTLVVLAALAALVGCGNVENNLPDGPRVNDGPTADGNATIDAGVDAVMPDAGPNLVTLTVARSGTGMGEITSDSGLITCGATCSAVVPVGTVVTLTATADNASVLTRWVGGGCGTAPSCAVTVDADLTVTAEFAVAQRMVTVTLPGNGQGIVTSNVGGIACPGTCNVTVAHGTAMTLSATATMPSTFTGWSGACTGMGSCAITVNGDVTVGATFSAGNSLTVSRSGNASPTGLVSSSPTGINCGTDCSEVYSLGQVVTLSASAGGGSTFMGWSGGGCSGNAACVVTVNAATVVDAEFTLNSYLLTLNKGGTGTGTVTSNPVGINCGAACSSQSASFNHGQMVQLTASAAANSTFTGWSGGGCTGTGACVVTMTAATSVTASFALNSYTLTVTKPGTGTGTVTSSPSGINCGLDCSEAYTHGQVVVLTAAAANRHTFAGWSGGGCTGTGTCTVTVTAATTVAATFNPPPNYMFVTSSTHTGNLGGLSGADAICQARATAASLPGTFRAYLGTGSATAISRLGATASGWVRTDNKPFANSQADLGAGKIFYPPNRSETAAVVESTVWTGASNNGTSIVTSTCANWTDGTAAMTGNSGSNDYTTFGWVSNGGGTCSSPQPLYCFGIDFQATVTVPAPSGGFRRAFVSNGNFIPSAGRAAADTLCQGEATMAGYSGTFLALLPTGPAIGGGTSAVSRFTTSGGVWVRPDNVQLAINATQFLATTPTLWDSSLNVTANGNYITTRTWAGAATLTTAGASTTTCNNWASAASTSYGWVGLPASSRKSTAFANYATMGGITQCDNTQHRVYCLQQ